MDWISRTLLNLRTQRAPMFVLLLFLVSPFALNAYPVPVDLNGSLLRWDVSREFPRVTYQVKSNISGYEGILRQFVANAANLWTAVPGSFLEVDEAQQTEKANITFNFSANVGQNAHSAGYATFDEYKGDKPVHCSIYIPLESAGLGESLSKTIMHELGHCLGLGHSVIPSAIMSYSLNASTFALDVDDEAALTRLYPADGSKPRLPPGCAIADAIPSNSKGRWLALLLLPFAWMIMRRFDV